MTVLTPLIIGTLFQQGRYRVGRAIGHGGMGAVYEAIDQRLNARVALKQILRATPALRQAFEREAKLLANVRHTALPRVTDFFSEADADFIVMEFIDGKDLGQVLLERGALPVEEVLDWADQLLDVLNYLHTQDPPIVHRDIKPQNIKLTQSGMLVLLDFGIAKGSLGADTTTGGDQSVAAWTPHYAPPEQFLGEGTDQRSDIFALAATLYHLLTNQQPVPINRRLGQIQKDQPDPLQHVAQINALVPLAVSDLIYQAMARKGELRPPSAAVFRERLQAVPRNQALTPPAMTEVATTDDKQAPELPLNRSPEAKAILGNEHEGVVPIGTVPKNQQPGVGRATNERQSHATPRTGQRSLQKRLHTLVRQTLDNYVGAWAVWCDPRGDWRPLLERVAADSRLGGFELLHVADVTAGEIGGLRTRQIVQEYIDKNISFVLLVPVASEHLGWLWAQTLLAERVYTKSLHEQLLEWGWRSPSPTVTSDEVAILARQGLQQDPALWGGGGVQPDLPLLLEVLAGGVTPDADQEYLLDRTIEVTGLPALDTTALDRWRAQSLARLLVTQAYHVAPRLINTGHEFLIPEGQRALALDLLTRWSDSLRLSRRLPELIAEADRIAALGTVLHEVTAKHGPFVSRSAEQAVFASVCGRLGQKTGKDLLQALADSESDLIRHAQGFWGDHSSQADPAWTALSIPWSELLRLGRAARDVLAVAPSQDWGSPKDAIRWYTEGGWSLDAAGEEILRNLTRSSPELLSIINPLREAYRNRWEKTLLQWSDIWSAAGSPMPALPTAGTWLADALKNSRATAILMIDALRYDHAVSIAQMVNSIEGSERASVLPARAPLPSITALGMGMALPIPEPDLRAELLGNNWQLIEATSQVNLSVAENRRAWLRSKGIVPADGMLVLGDVIRGQVPSPTKARTRILVTDATIDQLGHDDELERMGSGVVLERYREAIIRLRDSGWLRILIVTDHGYIHWSGNNEKRLSPPIAAPAYRSRRALAYPTSTTISEPHTLAPGGQWAVVPSPGAACWLSYGGLGYFHGGASLQEWIIPCVRLDWPSKALPVEVSIQPIEYILSERPRIVLNVERGSLLVEDALPRHVDVVIRHAQTRAILFRSDQTEVSPVQDQRAVSLRRSSGATAERGAPLQIEVRDALTEEVINVTGSILRVPLDDF